MSRHVSRIKRLCMAGNEPLPRSVAYAIYAMADWRDVSYAEWARGVAINNQAWQDYKNQARGVK